MRAQDLYSTSSDSRPASQEHSVGLPFEDFGLAQLYGRTEVRAAIAQALQLETYDAAYVENLLLAERRRRQLPTPTLPTPQRRELIEDIRLEEPDPARYDRLCDDGDPEPEEPQA